MNTNQIDHVASELIETANVIKDIQLSFILLKAAAARTKKETNKEKAKNK